MTKHRQLLYGQPIPQDFLDALQEFIGTMASPNLDLTMVTGSQNQIQILAGTGSAQVGLAIDGLWRYISAPTTTTVSGSAATYDIFVTTGNNSFSTNPSPPPPELDATDYTFTLATPLLQGNTPAAAHYRKVGEAVFDGTRIVSLRQMIDIDSSQGFQTGDLKLSAVANPQAGWLLCNGQAVNRATFAALYAALGGSTSPWGQGDLSTTFNVPDLRSRAPIGAGQGAGLTNRPLGTYSTLTTGQTNTGEEKHLLLNSEMPVHSHGGATGGGATGGGTTGTESAAHTHAQSVANANVPVTQTGGQGAAVLGGTPPQTGTESALHTHSVPALSVPALAINSDGGGVAHSVMPPFAAVNYFIKT